MQPVDVDETARGGEAPDHYVRRLAVLKAETLWQKLAAAQRQPVLGADTAVVLDDEILGKPRDEQDCLRMLKLLSARTHQVFTAVALRASDGCQSRVNVSEVTFRKLADDGDPALLALRRARRQGGRATRCRDARRCSSSASPAAIPESWACRCSRPASCWPRVGARA